MEMTEWKEEVKRGKPMPVHTCVVWRTQTGVVAHAVHTGGAVLTSVVLTVVHVHLAESSMETKRTCTAKQIKTKKQIRLTAP